MQLETKKYLTDIVLSIHHIQLFLVDTPHFLAYQADLKTKRAVERELAIIGEAMTKIIKIETITIQNDKQIIALRNRLVHAYDSINDEMIWGIIQRHLPLLKQEVEELLKTL